MALSWPCAQLPTEAFWNIAVRFESVGSRAMHAGYEHLTNGRFDEIGQKVSTLARTYADSADERS